MSTEYLINETTKLFNNNEISSTNGHNDSLHNSNPTSSSDQTTETLV